MKHFSSFSSFLFSVLLNLVKWFGIVQWSESWLFSEWLFPWHFRKNPQPVRQRHRPPWFLTSVDICGFYPGTFCSAVSVKHHIICTCWRGWIRTPITCGHMHYSLWWTKCCRPTTYCGFFPGKWQCGQYVGDRRHFMCSEHYCLKLDRLSGSTIVFHLRSFSLCGAAESSLFSLRMRKHCSHLVFPTVLSHYWFPLVWQQSQHALMNAYYYSFLYYL